MAAPPCSPLPGFLNRKRWDGIHKIKCWKSRGHRNLGLMIKRLCASQVLSFINQVEVNYSHKEAGKERRTFSGSPLLGWGRGLPGRRDKLHWQAKGRRFRQLKSWAVANPGENPYILFYSKITSAPQLTSTVYTVHLNRQSIVDSLMRM